MRYNEGGEIIEITIRDNSGAKIETYKFQVDDKDRANHIIYSIIKKYGLKRKKEENRDIDWMKKF